MQQRMEIIKFNEKLPMRLYCYRLTELKAHWHSGIEIILILKGDCSVIVNDQIVNMQEDDERRLERASFDPKKSMMLAVILPMLPKTEFYSIITITI